VFIGTLFPLALEVVTGAKISVGPPYFNLTFGPLLVALMIAVPFGPMLAWKRGDLLGASQRLLAAGVAALLAIAFVWAWTRSGSALAPLAIRPCDLCHRRRRHRPGRAYWAVPHAARNRDAAHARPAALDLGHGFRPCRARHRADRHRLRDDLEQRIYRHHEGRGHGEDCRLRIEDGRPDAAAGANYRELVASFAVSLDGERLRAMTPSKRNFTTRAGMSTTEAALLTRGVSQLYVSLGEATATGGIAVRIYH